MAWFWNKNRIDQDGAHQEERLEVHSEMLKHLQLISRQTDNVAEIADEVLYLTERMASLEEENQILRDKISTLEEKEF